MTREIFSSKVSSSGLPYVIEEDENVLEVLEMDVEAKATLGGELERDLLFFSFPFLLEPLPLTCRSGIEGRVGLEKCKECEVKKMVQRYITDELP